MDHKIEQLLRRLQEVEIALSDPLVFSDQIQYKALAKEHAYLMKVQEGWGALEKARQHLQEYQQLLQEESDLAMQELLREEIQGYVHKTEHLEQELETILVPPDPDDDCNVIMELRAGTGGDEAALFVGECVRMYQLFAVTKGWHVDVLSFNASELGGFKEYIMALSGSQVYRYMKYEAGTHRVQRVPATEAQGRVHTSAITIAVLKETEESQVVINEKDLKIETCRSSGAGGQHVNVTDSAVRIVHLPTGLAVSCQAERSQHKNKDKAMRLLVAKVAQEEEEKKNKQEAELRASQVGSGDRSERIRTYNFPQNRLTDHRIGLTLYSLDEIFQHGNLEEVCTSLIRAYHQRRLDVA